MSRISVHATTDDEARAREIAERLAVEEGRKAFVMTVREMHLYRYACAPRTANRFAVVVEAR